LISVLYAAGVAVWGDGVKTTLLVPLIIGAVAAIAVTDQTAGVPLWRHLNEDLERATARIEVLVAETESLQAQIDALESEPFALEQAIREDLVLARPGEVIVRFRSDDDTLW
jgi:cell division protein FtsB